MSETSRNRVTITLGRSGQVVKRAGPTSGVSFNDSLAVTGTKRSVRDRLGSNSDASLLHGSQPNSKRQRGNIGMSGPSFDGLNEMRIGKDDLRLKLLQKNALKRAEHNDKRVDLREKLSKSIEHPVSSLDSRYCLRQSLDTSSKGRISSTRSVYDIPQMDSYRNSYSTWAGDHSRQMSLDRIQSTVDHSRQRSPDRIQATSRGRSPQRNMGDLQRRPSNRTFEHVRSDSYISKDILDSSFPGTVNASHFMTPGTAKPLAPTIPPPSSIMAKSSYPGDELQTIEGLLHSLGLGKYAIILKAEEVDMAALRQMGENDLKEIGIPMGPRKKILLALAPRSKRQP